MVLDIFVVIGGDHESNVYHNVTNLLDSIKPDIITVEQFLRRTTWKHYKAIHGYQDFKECIRIAYKPGNPYYANEIDTSILYALKNHLPLYFVDGTTDGVYLENILASTRINFTNSSIRWIPKGDVLSEYGVGKYKGEIVYEDLSIKCDIYSANENNCGLDNINERNIFSIACINKLADTARVIAHAGGRAHFDESVYKDCLNMHNAFKKDYVRLQDLVNAKTKIYYDSLTDNLNFVE
jgi:hypothetical protein